MNEVSAVTKNKACGGGGGAGSFCHVGTEQKVDGLSLQRAVPRAQSCWHGCPAFFSVRTTVLLCRSHPIYGTCYSSLNCPRRGYFQGNSGCPALMLGGRHCGGQPRLHLPRVRIRGWRVGCGAA